MTDQTKMKRRDFIIGSGLLTGGVLAATSAAQRWAAAAEPLSTSLRLTWTRDAESRLFTAARCDGDPLVRRGWPGLLDGFCRLVDEAAEQAAHLVSTRSTAVHGRLRAELRHRLRQSGQGRGEDLLEARLSLVNTSDKTQTAIIGFTTSVQPSPDWARQSIFIPLSATIDHPAMGQLCSAAHKQADYAVGQRKFVAHYLEPLASDPDVRVPVAPLLVPVLDIYHANTTQHVSLMTPSGQPRRFATLHDGSQCLGWSVQTIVTLAPGQEFTDRCFLLIHNGDAARAWSVFHGVAHHEDWPAVDWLVGARVHYFDFLSAANPAGRRGDGYEAAIPHFREFHVGLATQHGYYRGYGDYIHPDEPAWLAMPKDRRGSVPISLDKIGARLKAAHQSGAKAAIYMHLTAMDDSSERFFPTLRLARLIGRDGQPVKYPWDGPDVKGQLWQMSMAAPSGGAPVAAGTLDHGDSSARRYCRRRDVHGFGIRRAPEPQGPLSRHSIDFFKQLRRWSGPSAKTVPC